MPRALQDPSLADLRCASILLTQNDMFVFYLPVHIPFISTLKSGIADCYACKLVHDAQGLQSPSFTDLRCDSLLLPAEEYTLFLD